MKLYLHDVGREEEQIALAGPVWNSLLHYFRELVCITLDLDEVDYILLLVSKMTTYQRMRTIPEGVQVVVCNHYVTDSPIRTCSSVLEAATCCLADCYGNGEFPYPFYRAIDESVLALSADESTVAKLWVEAVEWLNAQQGDTIGLDYSLLKAKLTRETTRSKILKFLQLAGDGDGSRDTAIARLSESLKPERDDLLLDALQMAADQLELYLEGNTDLDLYQWVEDLQSAGFCA